MSKSDSTGFGPVPVDYGLSIPSDPPKTHSAKPHPGAPGPFRAWLADPLEPLDRALQRRRDRRKLSRFSLALGQIMHDLDVGLRVGRLNLWRVFLNVESIWPKGIQLPASCGFMRRFEHELNYAARRLAQAVRKIYGDDPEWDRATEWMFGVRVNAMLNEGGRVSVDNALQYTERSRVDAWREWMRGLAVRSSNSGERSLQEEMSALDEVLDRVREGGEGVDRYGRTVPFFPRRYAMRTLAFWAEETPPGGAAKRGDV